MHKENPQAKHTADNGNELHPFLAIGRLYKIKESEKIKVTQRCVQFTGVEYYKGEERWNFFDSKTQLHHWLHPYTIEPCTTTFI